jgi:hypothetical protein
VYTTEGPALHGFGDLKKTALRNIRITLISLINVEVGINNAKSLNVEGVINVNF